MHHDEVISTEAIQGLIRTIDIEVNQPNITWEILHQLVSERLVYLLLHDMEGLLQLLYKVDVNEKKVKEAFAQNNPKAIAPELARLIIARELEKAKHRRDFKP
jgi:hypothetical protein